MLKVDDEPEPQAGGFEVVQYLKMMLGAMVFAAFSSRMISRRQTMSGL
jgi:hypothetical protein